MDPPGLCDALSLPAPTWAAVLGPRFGVAASDLVPPLLLAGSPDLRFAAGGAVEVDVDIGAAPDELWRNGHGGPYRRGADGKRG